MALQADHRNLVHEALMVGTVLEEAPNNQDLLRLDRAGYGNNSSLRDPAAPPVTCYVPLRQAGVERTALQDAAG